MPKVLFIWKRASRQRRDPSYYRYSIVFPFDRLHGTTGSSPCRDPGREE